MNSFDVRIQGAGIVSRAMALALARSGLKVALQARSQADGSAPDLRAYALNPTSVALLTGLKAWDALPADARTAVYDMKVAGDAPGALIEFSAWAQAVPELAWIVDAAALEDVLDAATRFAPQLTLHAETGTAALTLGAASKP